MYRLSYIATLGQIYEKFVNATQVGSYLPSSYSLSLIYSEHDNTQLVCNKQYYRTSNLRKCMGVNGEALQLPAVLKRLQITQESISVLQVT